MDDSYEFPKISIVVACLNAEKTIGRTLSSIECQEYPHLELIVVDGASADGTLSVVEQYRHMVTILISEKDNGVANALNKGFERASGNVFCYVNADDCLNEGALNAVARYMTQYPEVDLVTGGCKRIFDDESVFITQVPDGFERVMSLRNDLEQPSTFWRSTIHRKAGRMDESYALAFDWEWWNRMYRAGARFMVVRDVLSTYYFSEENLTSKAGMKVVNEMYRITKKYGPYYGFSAYVYKLLFFVFDLNGYYDCPFDQLSAHRQRVFKLALYTLYAIFGKEVINSYNWNWASKQVRGITWYN